MIDPRYVEAGPVPFYSEDGIVIYHGDCRDILPTLQCVDVVITDPPYSEYVHGKSRRGGAEAGSLKTGNGKQPPSSFSRVKEFGFDSLGTATRERAAMEFARVCARWVLVFSDIESSHLWREDLVAFGLDYVRTGAWVKLGATPQFTGDRPAAGFESITIAHPKGKKRWNGGGTHAVWPVPIVLNRSHSDPRLHTTQKPAELMRRLITLFSDEGETILDAFMGSGTTLAEAKRLGRKAIGIELEEKYCEIAVNRLRQEVLQFT